MRHLILLLAVTAALSCTPKSVLKLIPIVARSSFVTIRWSQSPAIDRNCVRGYRICLNANGSKECADVQNNSMNEYTVKNLPSCKAAHISVETILEKNATAAEVDLQATTAPGPVTGLNVTRNNEHAIVAKWEYGKTPENSCAKQFHISLCDGSGTNCTGKVVGVNDGIQYSQVLGKRRDCGSYVIKIVALDGDQQKSDDFNFHGLPELIGNKTFDRAVVMEPTSSSMTVSWETKLSNNDCVAAYSVCWKKKDAASEDCRNVTNDENNLQITGLSENTKYQVSISALFQTGRAFDNVTLQALTKSGAGGIYHNYLAGISTMIYLLAFFI